MPHPHLPEARAPFHADADAHLLHGISLPDSAAVRAEVLARLRDAERPAPKRPAPARRIGDWLPRWVGWLRAMPLP